MEQIQNQEQKEMPKATQNLVFGKPYLIGNKVVPGKKKTEVLFNEKHIINTFLTGVILAVAYFLTIFLIDINFYFSAVLGFGILLLYVSLLFFLIQPRINTVKERLIIRDIAYPAVREVYKPIIIEKEVIRYKERPVIHYVPREVKKFVERPVIEYVPRVEEKIMVKKVFVKEPKRKLAIPKYAYVGSTQTRKFHKKTCRLGKLIKKKYKINSNSKKFFEKKKFMKCKSCLKR